MRTMGLVAMVHDLSIGEYARLAVLGHPSIKNKRVLVIRMACLGEREWTYEVSV